MLYSCAVPTTFSFVGSYLLLSKTSQTGPDHTELDVYSKLATPAIIISSRITIQGQVFSGLLSYPVAIRETGVVKALGINKRFSVPQVQGFVHQHLPDDRLRRPAGLERQESPQRVRGSRLASLRATLEDSGGKRFRRKQFLLRTDAHRVLLPHHGESLVPVGDSITLVYRLAWKN